MKNIYLSILLCCWTLCCFAQKEPIETSSSLITVKAIIDMQKEEQELSDFPNNSILKKPKLLNKDGDIYFEYQLKPLKVEEWYQLQIIQLKNEASNIVYPLKPEFLYGNMNQPFKPGKNFKGQLLLVNPANNANFKYLEGPVEIQFLTKIFEIDKRCLEKPVFNLKRKVIPHVTGLAIGAGVWWYGHKLKGQSDDFYLDYLKAQSAQDGQTDYKEANDKHHKSLDMKALGIGLASASAATFIFRLIRYNGQKAEYERWCPEAGKNVLLTPYMETSPIAHSGISLALKF